MDGHPILLRQPKHANIPYANHTKRDDTLWGSWHWAVSGPIGPNLPVFGNTNHPKWSSLLDVARLTNKETNYTINDWILTIESLDLKFQAKRSFILSSFSFLLLSSDVIPGTRRKSLLVFECSRLPAMKRKTRNENIWKRWKNENLWARFSEQCPPSWSRLTTGVDKRNLAISLLPYLFHLLVSFCLFVCWLSIRSLLLVILSPHTVITIVFVFFLLYP